MKIAAYEVRPDEKPVIESLCKKYGIDLISTSANLDKTTANMATGCDGVTTLGQSDYCNEVLDELKGYGVQGAGQPLRGLQPHELRLRPLSGLPPVQRCLRAQRRGGVHRYGHPDVHPQVQEGALQHQRQRLYPEGQDGARAAHHDRGRHGHRQDRLHRHQVPQRLRLPYHRQRCL